MRALSGLVGNNDSGRTIFAATFAALLFLFAVSPFRLMGERVELIRKGVMVDETVCESAERRIDWREFESRHFNIYSERDVDLNAIDMRLRKRLFFLSQKTPDDISVEAKIAYRLDAICERAMELLDMRTKMPNVGIKIFTSSVDLAAAYQALIGKTGNPKAFYAHDCRIIYTSEEDVTDSVMAHEIAHAIIDSHYNGIPPPKVGEMLASYVDMHIAD